MQLYDPWFVPFWQTRFFLWFLYVGLIGFIVASACVLGYIVYNKRKSVVILCPAERAQRELYVLIEECSSDSFDVSESKRIYSQLTAILKRYFHGRYGKQFMASTDNEMIVLLEPYLTVADLDQLRLIVQGAIEVKFSQQENALTTRNYILGDIQRALSVMHTDFDVAGK